MERGRHFQNVGPSMMRPYSLAPHFGNVPHLWDLPIVKHKVNIVMNLKHAKVEGIRGGRSVFSLHNFYVENLAKFALKITKFNQITLEKYIFPKFLTFFFF
jgi:hypothetical protein